MDEERVSSRGSRTEFDTDGTLAAKTSVNYTDAGYNVLSWTQLAPVRVVNNAVQRGNA